MSEVYEPANPLSMPFECFDYDSTVKPFPIKPHWHYFAELIVVITGNVLLTAQAEKIILTPGQAFFIFPHVTHSIYSADGYNVHYAVIKLDLNQLDDAPSYAPNIRDVIMDASAHNVCPRFDAETVKQLAVREKMEQCIQEYQSRVWGYDLLIRSTIYTLLLSFLRHWMDQGFVIRKNIYQSSLFTSINNITCYIKSHLKENLRVEELARNCGMSYPNFASKFREIYGISCKEYIERVRITRVEHFLRFTDFDLAYISQEAGYADCSHMIRDFRNRKGMTPNNWRKQEVETTVPVPQE